MKTIVPESPALGSEDLQNQGHRGVSHLRRVWHRLYADGGEVRRQLVVQPVLQDDQGEANTTASILTSLASLISADSRPESRPLVSLGDVTLIGSRAKVTSVLLPTLYTVST